MTGNVFAVTVTYGRRWHLLRATIAAAHDEGVDAIVVVDNASQEDIAALAAAEFGAFADVVSLPRNTGSAGGFKAGIERAMARGAEYLFLLDDDNRPERGCLSALRAGHRQELSAGASSESLAMLAFRSHFHLDLAMGVPPERVFGRPGSFFNFHLLDIPFKIWRRLPFGRESLARRALPERVVLGVAPWGGLYFHRALIERHGYPKAEYVVYTEDYEFTYRITSSGGRIVLLTQARIDELEPSWITKTQFSNSYDAWLLGAGDFRAYYGFRNQTHFEMRVLPPSLWRRVNCAAYMGLLRIFALLRGRSARLALIRRAFADGLAGRLGEHPEFPL